MKINWNYFTKQRGIVILSLVMCMVILGSANYIYSRNSTDIPDIPNSGDSTVDSGNADTGNSDTDSDSQNPSADTPVSGQDYFEAYRANRQSIRDMEMKYVQTISGNEGTDAEVKKEAEARLLAIASLMEKELKLENLIKAKGFEDAIAFVEDGAINIVVKAKEISGAQATKILKLVVDETGEAPQNVTIITKT